MIASQGGYRRAIPIASGDDPDLNRRLLNRSLRTGHLKADLACRYLKKASNSYWSR